MHVVLDEAGKVSFGLAIDAAVLRDYHAVQGLDDQGYMQRAGGLLRAHDATLTGAIEKGVPAGLAFDEGAMNSAAVKKLVGGV